jgi:hypothetical protein
MKISQNNISPYLVLWRHIPKQRQTIMIKKKYDSGWEDQCHWLLIGLKPMLKMQKWVCWISGGVDSDSNTNLCAQTDWRFYVLKCLFTNMKVSWSRGRSILSSWKEYPNVSETLVDLTSVFFESFKTKVPDYLKNTNSIWLWKHALVWHIICWIITGLLVPGTGNK